jgi:hypothetical protein
MQLLYCHTISEVHNYRDIIIIKKQIHFLINWFSVSNFFVLLNAIFKTLTDPICITLWIDIYWTWLFVYTSHTSFLLILLVQAHPNVAMVSRRAVSERLRKDCGYSCEPVMQVKFNMFSLELNKFLIKTF